MQNSHVDRRSPNEIVGTNVSDAILAAGTDAESVAQAADLTSEELRLLIAGVKSFTIPQLVKVGGFLHVQLCSLLEGLNPNG